MRWIPIHDFYLSLGQQKCEGILFFHAFTGCDIVSAFRGKGKKTAWQILKIFPEVTEVFAKLSQYPPIVTDRDVHILEKFVVMMYNKSSTLSVVNDARMDMFARKEAI